MFSEIVGLPGEIGTVERLGGGFGPAGASIFGPTIFVDLSVLVRSNTYRV